MPFFRQCSENNLRSTHSAREAKIRSFCIQTLSLEPWRSRHFGLLSRPGPLSFRECPLFGVQPVPLLAAFVTTLQLGWWSVASLKFTRKCLLRASDCGCGNGFSSAEDRGLSRSRFNRHSPGFNQHSPVSFAPFFGSQMREWLSL